MLMGTEYVDFSDDPSYITGSVPKKTGPVSTPVAAYVAALDGTKSSGFLDMSSTGLLTMGLFGLLGLGWYFYDKRGR